jgi:hypothetical protein
MINIFGKFTKRLEEIDTRLAQIPCDQLNETLQKHMSAASLEMFILRLGLHTAVISSDSPKSLKVEPARYFPEAMLFFIFMWFVGAIVGYIEGGPLSETLHMLSIVPVMMLAYGIMFLGISRLLLINCSDFLRRHVT